MKKKLVTSVVFSDPDGVSHNAVKKAARARGMKVSEFYRRAALVAAGQEDFFAHCGTQKVLPEVCP